jgi:hypothetical protein
MKKLIVVALVASAALLAGCKEEAKSYDWYSEHPKETYQVYKKCLETGEASLNCDGARRAAIGFAKLGNDETKALFKPLMR